MRIGRPHWKKCWQDGLVALLGAWFAASAWLLELHESGVRGTSVALGLTLLALGIAGLISPGRWQHWCATCVGLAAAASPWLVGFAHDSVAWRNAVTVGLLCALLALRGLARERKTGKALHGLGNLAH
jgi:hypothetical protein